MLQTGKLDSDLLKSLIFGKIKYRNEDVKVRPGIGEDCAVIGFGDYDCVMSTDPITAAVSQIGRLAIYITCNDIASNGVQPLGIMLAVLLPEGTTEEDVAAIMGQAADTAAEVGVEIIGGHTEITPVVTQPVIISTAIGKTLAGTSQTGDRMEEGDRIMMTKSVGLEGTGILATDKSRELQEVLTGEELARAAGFLDQVNVVREGITAGRVGTHGMHDITEGGLLGAVWEMCQISGLGAEIDAAAIPMEPETAKVCAFFGADPLRMISSGSLVMIVPPEKEAEMIRAMEYSNLNITTIGTVRAKEFGVKLRRGETLETVESPKPDEIYRALFKNK